MCSAQGLDRLVSRGCEPRNQPLGARRGWTLVSIPEAVLPPVERGQEAVGITGSTGLFKQLLKFPSLYNLSLIKACFFFLVGMAEFCRILHATVLRELPSHALSSVTNASLMWFSLSHTLPVGRIVCVEE